MEDATEEEDLSVKLILLATKCKSNISEFQDGSKWCPPVWDGLLCWPATPAGTLKSLACPKHMPQFNHTGNATRNCMEDGKWYWNDIYNSTWTNYTECFVQYPTQMVTQHHQTLFGYIPKLTTISQVGYTVSLVTLIIAFCILATFKGLRVPRNKVHMHLFMSFMLRAFTTLFKGLEVDRVSQSSTTKEGLVLLQLRNDWETCRVVVSIWQYFLLANYSWILMEGLYLHNLIFLALFSDTSSISLYVALGWGLPLLFIVPWITARIVWDNTLCWTTVNNSYVVLLLKGPITLSVILNFILFVKIVRVLLLKLRASVNEQNRRFRRWAKSTLVLMPLFGVHYTLFIMMPYVKCGPELEAAWLFGEQFFSSFQGFFVALLYCFMNGEVRAELNKKCRRWWVRHHGSPPSFRRQSNVTSTTCGVKGSKFHRKDKRKSMGRLETSVTSVTCSSFPDTTRKSLPNNCLHNNVHENANWSSGEGAYLNSRLTGNGIELVPLKEKYEL